MIRIFDYEFSFRHENTSWYCEEKDHRWEWIFRIEWLSPKEKEHRAELEEIRRMERKLKEGAKRFDRDFGKVMEELAKE